jgi:hypothetical protein
LPSWIIFCWRLMQNCEEPKTVKSCSKIYLEKWRCRALNVTHDIYWHSFATLSCERRNIQIQLCMYWGICKMVETLNTVMRALGRYCTPAISYQVHVELLVYLTQRLKDMKNDTTRSKWARELWQIAPSSSRTTTCDGDDIEQVVGTRFIRSEKRRRDPNEWCVVSHMTELRCTFRDGHAFNANNCPGW